MAYRDGRPFPTEDYRVTLFLQTEKDGAYWVKPTYAQPYVRLREDGSFSLDYTTGGIDEQAVTLYLFLIRSNIDPSDFAYARSRAWDSVTVDRWPDGNCRVFPTSAEGPVPETSPRYAPAVVQAKDAALAALTERLQGERDSLYVYRDCGDTANRFPLRAKAAGQNEALVKDMDECWRLAPYAGTSCIRCTQETAVGDWGGWLFLNGSQKKGDAAPRLPDGKKAGLGFDLTGADALRFYAKGERGGEQVEFFTAGFGYDGETGKKKVKYADSAPKQSLGFVTLTEDWREYVIPLQDVDVSSLCCGFGYTLSGAQSGDGASVFYLDEIRFTGKPEALQEAPVLLRSCDTYQASLTNAAFTDDNALAAMAFLSADRWEQAEALLDALVYAAENDRYASGIVRNAYAAGGVAPSPGWKTGARLPGWADGGVWREEPSQVGCGTGSTAYAALALLQYDGVRKTKTYLKTAEKLLKGLLKSCQDDTPGFTAGWEGWPEGKTPEVTPLTYKSTEQNMALYAAFTQLYQPGAAP